ncbi:MAG TPA: aldo/keto reductase [Terriglobales bacterium]|nr:aldo/keto reductase [Terriglobales bacterium]
MPELRNLGNSGIQVKPLCLGGNVFGWTLDEAGSFRILDGFFAVDFNFIDTADIYPKWVPGNKGGESETIIGKWMKERHNRKKVILATKCGHEWGMGPGKAGLSKNYILEAAEDSLRRLQTDYIDLYQAHQDDPKVPLDETLEAFAHLIRSGKVRAIGASNYSAQRLQEALRVSKTHNLPRYETLQPHYNLYERNDYESTLENVCVREGLGVIPYFSLASGFLTGKYRSKTDVVGKARGSRVEKYLNERGFRILDALDRISNERNSTAARVALAWLIARPSVTAPIASATKLDQLTDLIEATKLKLRAAEVELLNAASAEAAEPVLSREV